MEKILVKQRDIVLLPFPFSDQSGLKVRPAIIISNNRFNATSEDVIVCAITSNIEKSKYTVLIDQKNLEEGYLYNKSAIKAENILKVKKSLIIKTIATVNKDILLRVVDLVKEILYPALRD